MIHLPPGAVMCCENCCFWKRMSVPFIGSGECHRHAPVALTVATERTPVRRPGDRLWPPTFESDACGDFEHRASAQCVQNKT